MRPTDAAAVINVMRLLAHSGDRPADALSGAVELPPDVIVTELLERTPDGWRTPEMLKHDPRTAHIPLIAVTSWVMQEDQERALQSGCDAVLPKPVGPVELVKVINDLLLS